MKIQNRVECESFIHLFIYLFISCGLVGFDGLKIIIGLFYSNISLTIWSPIV